MGPIRQIGHMGPGNTMQKYTQKLPSYTFTREGYAAMQQELEDLTAKRPAAIEDLQKARALGDLKENGYYQASRQKVNSIDHRLRQLKLYLKYGKIIEASGSDTVGIGNSVTVHDGTKEITYSLVGQHEANPSEKKLSDRSPIGKALIGKKVGETVAIAIPIGTRKYKIMRIL
jgi:transcription elongation factor GreA